jgi:hypothetical protein
MQPISIYCLNVVAAEDSLHTLESIQFIIYSIDQKKVFGEPKCGSGIEAAVQKRRWRRLARAASMTAEETGGVEGGGVESAGDLESFVLKNETTRGGLLFIGSKISAVVL